MMALFVDQTLSGILGLPTQVPTVAQTGLVAVISSDLADISGERVKSILLAYCPAIQFSIVLEY